MTRWYLLMRRIGLLCLILPAGPASLCAAPDSADPPVRGSRQSLNGVTIVRVWGSPFERGFAHGYLMADEIRSFLINGMFNQARLKSRGAYETIVLHGLLSLMEIEPRFTEEIRGLHQGMLARLGPKGMHVDWLDRGVSVRDLTVYNCFADFFGLMCSTFTVWGGLSTEGVLTARNLDYPLEADLRLGQCLLVQLDQTDGRMDFVSLNWPGQIGCVTAMNADGVTLAIHDTPGVLFDPALKYRPRLLQMRSAIEAAAGHTAFRDAARALASGPTIVGNNVHMSRPARFGTQPAAVLEYDGRTDKGPGVTIRTAAENAPGVPDHALICTNHYRARRSPVPCDRFAKMQAELRRRADAQEPLSIRHARVLMSSVARRHQRLFTLHTVYFLPDRRALELSVSTRTIPAAEIEPVRFSLDDLLTRHPN